jgi:hypothetical protein
MKYNLLACLEIETIMCVDAKRNCDSKEFQENNRGLYDVWNAKLQKSKITLNDYIDFTYYIDSKKCRFVEDLYRLNFKVTKYIFFLRV